MIRLARTIFSPITVTEILYGDDTGRYGQKTEVAKQIPVKLLTYIQCRSRRAPSVKQIFRAPSPLDKTKFSAKTSFFII